MSRLRATLTVLMAPVATVALAGSVMAQSVDPAPPDTARQLGPLVLAPAFRLTEVGHDGNVYNDSENPRSDVTGTASPSVGAWLRLPVVRLSGRGQVDFIYFRRLTELRAVDRAFTARAEVPLRRLTPYLTVGRAITRDGRNFEIDLPVRRRDRNVEAGADVRVTGKVTIGASARRSRVEYAGDILHPAGVAESLNRTGEAEGVRFRYAVTPLTSFGVTSERQRDRFTSVTGRDADSLWITPEVEFQPLALVRGRAQVGFRSMSYDDVRTPDYRGTAARVDLQYTLLGRTSFSVGFQRDLEYSYLAQTDYVLSGALVAVQQRLSEPWEVGASVGRYRLNYRSLGVSGLGSPSPGERVISLGADAGYRTGRTRVGFQVGYSRREVDVSTIREYDRLRLTSSVTHDF